MMADCRKILLVLSGVASLLFLGSCNKDVRTFSDVHFSFSFDPDQERLDNFGDPVGIEVGHAVQDPAMQLLSVHYIELIENEFTQLGDGAVLYKAPETTIGGEVAIDFDQSALAASGEEFLKVNLEKLPAGSYKYIRASVAYQQYGISYDVHNVPLTGSLEMQSGNVASFIGYRTYIRDLNMENLTIPVNANKEQGFWGFETLFTDILEPYNGIYTGQAPEGATTVVNPLNATSPIPAGSCVITGQFPETLEVSGTESEELYIVLSFSTNGSFEWIDTDIDGRWDIDAGNPDNTEQVTDMGLRGMLPEWEWK